MTAKGQRVSRRGLLKTAGIAAGASAAPLAVPALVSGPAPAAGRIHKRPWWVRTVERPTLGETTGDFQRFEGSNIFALYRKLRTSREGEGAYKAEQEAKAKRIAEWIRQNKPGFGLRDRQIMEAGWTVMRSARPGEGLLAWTRVRVSTPAELGVDRYAASPEEMANTVKAAARLYGAGSAGIAPMNEKYVNLKQGGKDIVIEDADAPAVTEQKFVIPKKMKWVVAIAIPMDLDLITRAPTALGEGATTLGYSLCAFVVATLAEFIRGLGYQAIPSVNDAAQSVPFAVDAGLGEMSRLNRLITPRFGPAVRLAKVFTDMPMACDKPIDFGVVEFCKRCQKCAEACPSRALSFDAEPSFRVKGPWNNPGHKAWFEDSYKCYQRWQEITTDCGICFAVCPYTKAAKAWIHEFVKATASVAPAAAGLFRAMDDVFGYGRQHDPQKWWTQDLPPFGLDSEQVTEG